MRLYKTQFAKICLDFVVFLAARSGHIKACGKPSVLQETCVVVTLCRCLCTVVVSQWLCLSLLRRSRTLCVHEVWCLTSISSCAYHTRTVVQRHVQCTITSAAVLSLTELARFTRLGGLSSSVIPTGAEDTPLTRRPALRRSPLRFEAWTQL